MLNKLYVCSDGPFVQGLDRALSTFYVERQAYYIVAHLWEIMSIDV